MSRARDGVFAAASVVFGATWLFAASMKLYAPTTAYEFAARVVPPGVVTKAVFVAVVAGETWLGASMALRALDAVRGFALSLAGLAVACGALLLVRSHAKVGEIIQCGCYGDALRGSLDDELVRNAVMAGVLVILLTWNVIGRRAK